MKTKITLFAIVVLFTNVLKAQNTPQDFFSRSYAYEKALNYQGAITMIQSIYQPTSYEMNLRLGYLHYLSAKYADAISYYEKAINIMPNSIEARLGYILPAAATDKWDDVVKQYNAILVIEPRNSYVNYNLATIHYNRKNYTEAYKHFEIVYNLYPFDYGDMLMFAWSNYQVGKAKEAKVLFEKVLLNSPYDKSALDGIARIK